MAELQRIALRIMEATYRTYRKNDDMPKDRDTKISIPPNARSTKSSRIDSRTAVKRPVLDQSPELSRDESLQERIGTSHPALDEPSIEGHGRAQGEKWLGEAGRGDETRERIEEGLGEIGRQRQDGGIGIGFSTTFGGGKGGKQSFGVIGDPGGDLGLGAVGAGVTHGERGYSFGLGTGKVGGPIKVTTLEDIIRSSSGSKSGGSQSGGSTAGSTPAPVQSGEKKTAEDKEREKQKGEDDKKKEDDPENQGDSAKSDESTDTNTSKGDYPEPTGDPTVIPPPEGHTENGVYHDGSDGTPSGSLDRKEWLNPQGAAPVGTRPRINRRRPVLGPMRVGPSDGDGKGTGDVVIGTGNDRPVVPVIGGDGTGFKPTPCPEDLLIKGSRRLFKRDKPV